MTSVTSVSFTRALVGSGLADLVIPDAPGGPYWLDEDGLIEPELDPRNTFADDSAHVAGSLLTQSVAGLETLGFNVYTMAANATDLQDQKDALRAVLRQFTYTSTLTLLVPKAYTSLPGKLSWGTADSGMVKGLIAKGVVTIPVQPLEA